MPVVLSGARPLLQIQGGRDDPAGQGQPYRPHAPGTPHRRPLRGHDSAAREPRLTRRPRLHAHRVGGPARPPGSEPRARLQEGVKPACDYLSIWLIRF